MISPGSALDDLLTRARHARQAGEWSVGAALYRKASDVMPGSAMIRHNLALCLLGEGNARQARAQCALALQLDPSLWQAHIVAARALRSLDEVAEAGSHYAAVLASRPENGDARLGLADLCLNEFGDPLAAIEWVSPLMRDPEHAQDAELTTLMAGLYDRDESAATISARIRDFSSRALCLPLTFPARLPRARAGGRMRVALISPGFCASPVYFLTIAFFKSLAGSSDLFVFNRGHREDWATQAFRDLAVGWDDVAHLGAETLAQRIYAADIDVLYDLGGWMDPVALRALSSRPARRQYKWVGGQSATTGLTTFDGWIGDAWQSPVHLQHLYSEPLMNLDEDYARYTPPPYLPQPARRKSRVKAVFANPAKVSRAFLARLAQMPGKICFIHRQYRHRQVQARIEAVLGRARVEYICPGNHAEALSAVNRHQTLVDTFPYSSGLTAREALAMGTRIQVLKVGDLFCERHTARLAQQGGDVAV